MLICFANYRLQQGLDALTQQLQNVTEVQKALQAFKFAEALMNIVKERLAAMQGKVSF